MNIPRFPLPVSPGLIQPRSVLLRPDISRSLLHAGTVIGQSLEREHSFHQPSNHDPFAGTALTLNNNFAEEEDACLSQIHDNQQALHTILGELEVASDLNVPEHEEILRALDHHLDLVSRLREEVSNLEETLISTLSRQFQLQIDLNRKPLLDPSLSSPPTSPLPGTELSGWDTMETKLVEPDGRINNLTRELEEKKGLLAAAETDWKTFTQSLSDIFNSPEMSTRLEELRLCNARLENAHHNLRQLNDSQLRDIEARNALRQALLLIRHHMTPEGFKRLCEDREALHADYPTQANFLMAVLDAIAVAPTPTRLCDSLERRIEHERPAQIGTAASVARYSVSHDGKVVVDSVKPEGNSPAEQRPGP